MSRSVRDFDEDDIRVRPGRGKSRPRSKQRPSHEDATSGVVTAVDRGRFTVTTDDDITMYAMKARELGRKGLVVGDRVDVVGDTSGDTDTQGRIVRRGDRTTTLRRTADDVDPVERVIVANATQLGIVTATANPEPRTGLIDRALVAAYDAGLAPLLIITKPDLASPDELIANYADLDVPAVVVQKGTAHPELDERLRDEITVLIGHSGVGKSTLVNTFTDAQRVTGRVNTVTGRGRHTSTSAVAIPLTEGGWIIDTPGIRSFGLAHVDPSRVVGSFADLATIIERCPRGCSHNETECALNEAREEQPALAGRIDSLQRLLAQPQTENTPE